MQPLLLLHGAIGARDQLLPLGDILRDKFAIHILNFSGHGGTAFSNGDFSIPQFAAEVRSYLEQQNIITANIFGYSMGGYVSMYLAKQHPAVIGRIITLATKFKWDEAIAAKESKMLDADTISQKVPAFAEQLQKRHHPNDWKTVLDKTKDMLIGLGKYNSLQLEDYSTINSRCLLLLGEKDKMVSVDETIAVKQALPYAEFCLLPNTPHPIEQVDPQLLATFINDFLEN